MAAYSFMNVNASLAGPGGIITLGYGAAVAEEGITIEPSGDKDDMKVGADGVVMHTLRADKSGKATVRLQKTSPTNALLMVMYTFQTLSSANWGQNVLVISDTARNDIVTGTFVAFTKRPTLVYAKDAGMQEWAFNIGNLVEVLG